MRTLVIGGIEVPVHSLHDFRQSYSVVGGYNNRRRKYDGTGFAQEVWKRLKTVITASGILPPGFGSFEPTQQYVVQCAAGRKVESLSNVIALPAGRRSGGIYDPVGYAWVPEVGKHIADSEVEVGFSSVAGDTYTLNTHAGAQHYYVVYYPVITAYIQVTEDIDVREAGYGWTLDAEEV